MRENSREGKIRWIKFNCCAKQNSFGQKIKRSKETSFLKNVSIFFFLARHKTKYCEKEPLLLCERLEEQRRSMSRRKNPHPKRAVNARTVLKGEKEEPLVLCSRIPDEDDDLEANHHQIQKEERKKKGGRGRERSTSAMCARRF